MCERSIPEYHVSRGQADNELKRRIMFMTGSIFLRQWFNRSLPINHLA
jgi:hypothetical protein